MIGVSQSPKVDVRLPHPNALHLPQFCLPHIRSAKREFDFLVILVQTMLIARCLEKC